MQVVEKALVTQGGGLAHRPGANHGAVGSCVRRENPNYFKLLLVCLTESAHLVTTVTGAPWKGQWPWVGESKQAHTHTGLSMWEAASA